MKTVIGKSTFFTIIAFLVVIFTRAFLRTDTLLTDVGGVSAFVTVFGTLYGIMAAFVVFEVWAQFNKTSHLIDQESLGLERLFRLTLYFRDEKLTKQMKQAIERYARIVIEDKFVHLGSGKRNVQASQEFRKITHIIRDVKFDDDHDQIVYDHIVSHFGDLSQTRTERISHSLLRLPFLLRFFLYLTSFVAMMTFILMPFGSLFYHLFTVGAITFIISMVLQLVEDLDNPFVGHWNITVEPFERALKHIEEDY